ncbi:MAG TPA: hypothetical protein VKB38_20345 [Terracidiphilus sp.]|nr:hypothetical protein [Terracidiphilus sp.]
MPPQIEHEGLDQVFYDSQTCVFEARQVVTEMVLLIRKSREAVMRSKALIRRSDEVLRRVHELAEP